MKNAQRQAVRSYRERLARKGLTRFEVLGREVDRDLIRALAKKLAEGTSEASRLRAVVGGAMENEAARKGHILGALRASPLVGAGLDLKRESTNGRKVDV